MRRSGRLQRLRMEASFRYGRNDPKHEPFR
jgi:hypothetical protein